MTEVVVGMLSYTYYQEVRNDLSDHLPAVLQTQYFSDLAKSQHIDWIQNRVCIQWRKIDKSVILCLHFRCVVAEQIVRKTGTQAIGGRKYGPKTSRLYPKAVAKHQAPKNADYAFILPVFLSRYGISYRPLLPFIFKEFFKECRIRMKRRYGIFLQRFMHHPILCC